MRKLYPALLFLLPLAAFAITDDGCTAIICNPLNPAVWGNVSRLQDALPVIVDLFITISMPIIAILIIYTGFTFATSKGDQKQLEKARTMLTYIVVGALIMFAAKGIGMAVQSTLNTVAGPSSIQGTN
jgi:hypothetical protein